MGGENNLGMVNAKKHRRTSSLMNRKLKTKPISFGDMYGLGLLAKNPGGRFGQEIIEHLSPQAQKIAKAIVAPQKTSSKDTKSAAKELTNLAK